MVVLKNIRFIKGLLNNFDSSDIIKMMPLINRREILLNQTPVSSRIFNHWKKNKLIDIQQDNSDFRSWVKLSFVEYIWLSCVKELRDFGVSIKQIKEVKEKLFSEIINHLDASPGLIRMAIKHILKNYDIDEKDTLLFKSNKAPDIIKYQLKDEMFIY